MDILFLHNNYPAQFVHLARGLAAAGSHRVIYATARDPVPETEMVPGLQLASFRPHRPASAQIHPYLRVTEEAVLRGQAVLRCLDGLQQGGFQPRLVIFHAGMGLGMLLRQLLPKAILVGYCEWYFRPDTLGHLFETLTPDLELTGRLRNLPLLQELSEMDLGVVPTAWQWQQFPPEYRDKLKVVFDGIDTSFFHPAAWRGPVELLPEEGEALVLQPEQPVLSYATRGMEPLRGFPEFLRALPGLLNAEPTLQVVVAGRDRRAYSAAAPSHGGSWKQHLLAELGEFEGRERIHFTGLLSYEHYRRLLRRTDLHVYLSRPYVTSWSLFEAAACGAPILMNEGPATTGVLAEAAFARVDLDQPAAAMAEAFGLALRRSLALRREPRRSLLPSDLALPSCLDKWQLLLNQVIQQR